MLSCLDQSRFDLRAILINFARGVYVLTGRGFFSPAGFSDMMADNCDEAVALNPRCCGPGWVGVVKDKSC